MVFLSNNGLAWLNIINKGFEMGGKVKTMVKKQVKNLLKKELKQEIKKQIKRYKKKEREETAVLA